MPFPPVEPQDIALHELRKDFVFQKYVDSFDRILQLTDNKFAKLQVLYSYYLAYMKMGRKAEAEEILRLVRKVSIAGDRPVEMLRALVEANYFFFLRDIVSAEKQLNLALSIADPSQEHYFFALELKSRVLYAAKRIEESIECNRKIIKDANPSFLEIRASAYATLGMVFAGLHEFDEATSNLEEALLLFQSLGYVRAEAGVYLNLGAVAGHRYLTHSDTESLQESITYFHLALNAIHNTSDLEFKGRIIGNLGIAYADAQQFSEAMHYGQVALRMARETKLDNHIGSALAGLGGILLRARHYDEALKVLEECTSYFKFLQPEQARSMYEGLALACEHLALWEKGFYYHSQQVRYLEESYKEEKSAAIHVNKILVEKEHQHEKELRELDFLRMEEQVKSQALQIVSQTELLSKFREELLQIVSKSVSDSPDMKAVREKLKELPCKQIDWVKFEAEFRLVHPEFTRKLHERYPTLTPMEVKMCSLLRLNLKSHEIARLFCVTERAVEFHRLNIRKKCMLKRAQSLSVVLNSL